MNLSYRPEVDGLRTIAVMLVIFHHLGWGLFSGGYVGVDVFFVISGYLITKVVVAEVNGRRFSFLNFYKRRVIRLAPAYFLVLAFVSIGSLLVMLPAELLNYFNSARYATFFLANFYMWQEVGGYFSANADVIPLLHLWSLAVEEQFYIFWPIGLLLLSRLMAVRAVFFMLLAFVLLSVAISEWGVINYRAAAYYLMPTRAFELLMGAVLVFARQYEWSGVTRNVMGVVGLAAIFWSALSYTPADLFPGVNGVLPCFGTVLVLVFCRAENDFVGRLLSIRQMIFLGKISYPAYLWHWPIIVFINIFTIKIDFMVGLCVIFGTLILAAVTYFYVEIPAQRLGKRSAKFVIGILFVAPALILLTIAVDAKQEKGWPQRFSDSLNKKSEALLSYTHHARGRCNEGSVKNPLSADECVLGVKDKSVDFLLVGDSHANHFTGMIDVMARNARLRGYDITQSNTIFLPDTRKLSMQGGRLVELENFRVRNYAIAKKIKNDKFKAVILAGNFSEEYNSGNFQLLAGGSRAGVFERQFEMAIKLIQAAGSRVIIIKGSPALGDIMPDCVLSNERFGFLNRCNIDIKKYAKSYSQWGDFLQALSTKYPDILVIDPAKIMCDDRFCFSEINGIPLYRDGSHLNKIGSELIGDIYISKFGNPLLGFLENKAN